MTTKTNKELLESCKTHLEYGIDTVTPIMDDFQELFTRFEKQIPKKPIEEWSNSPFSEDRGCKYLHLMCPNCKKMEVCKMEYFCPRCGQAIDWSDVQ